MAKYIAFSWQRPVPMDKLLEFPVEQLLGTCDERHLPDDELPGREIEVVGPNGEKYNDISTTEMRLVTARVQMPENMMLGRDYLMQVYTSTWQNGEPHAIVAYYKIPRSER